jgi:hypothetical protein
MIEPGFYNPDQMATELTNKFNEAVTNVITSFFTNKPQYSEAANKFVTYDRFKVVYNSVNQKLWFGNTADKFVLTNDSYVYYKKNYVDTKCQRSSVLPNFSDWGLPSYLGLSRCPATSLNTKEVLYQNQNDSPFEYVSLISQQVPRFYYGDVTGTGDDGYWLLPSAPGATVYFLEAPFKICFMGPAYFYMEIDGLNCIDETSPWALSDYTSHTNNTNGIVNSSFAKIAIPTTPISQWFDNDMSPYKYFNPPAERIRKLNITLRYHNGQPVDFGQFNFSFMIEFNILRPQQERSYSIRNAFDLSQNQGYTSIN